MTVYFDYNATAPIRKTALAAVNAAYEAGGNPSSVHQAGRAAKAMVDLGRKQIASAVKCGIDDVVFTSGGTESNNLAIANAKHALACSSVLIGAGEHPSNLAPADAMAVPVARLKLQTNGLIDMDALQSSLLDCKSPLVVVMLANNETGVLQPMRQIADMVHEAGGFLHVDAAQAFGKIPVNFGAMGADTMTLAAHKLGGPMGIGALIVRCGLPFIGQTIGGSQETGRRAGTSNVAGIAGFGAAAVEAEEQLDRFAGLSQKRDHLEALLRDFASDLVVFGKQAQRLPNTLCCAALGFSSQTQLMALDLAGFAISSGSACSSGKVKASHVLAAMGVSPDLSGCAIRISLGWRTTSEEIEQFAEAWGEAYRRAVKGNNS